MYYFDTSKRELNGTNAHKIQASLTEKIIVDGHGCHTALNVGVEAKENQDKVPMLYWLLKLYKNKYKARLIAYSSFCMTSKLSKLFSDHLNAIKTCIKVLFKSV